VNIGKYLTGDHYLPYPNDDFCMTAEAGFDSIAFDLSQFCLSTTPAKITLPGKKVQVQSAQAKVAHSFTDSMDNLKKAFSLFKMAAEKYKLKFAQMNSIYLPQLPKGPERETEYYKAVRNCIELCGWMGSPYLTIHPFLEKSPRSREWQMRRSELLSLAAVAARHNVILCVENQLKLLNNRYLRGFCTEPHAAVEFIDSLNSELGEERFGFCLNTGACGLVGQRLYETVITLGNRIRAVCIQDNNGIWGQCNMPYTCTRNGIRSSTDWQGFVRGMREIGFKDTLSFAADSSISCFPSSMRFSVLKIIAETGRFMAEQIEIERTLEQCGKIVLFGSGNMFENYMDCYGKKYPPAFIADNNRRLWGDSKRGVPIKSPEAVKELSDSYGVFICNQFYHEIERQLIDLGAEHIYRFNDEYMPLLQNLEAK
jgi:Xylose isomerase-like TIM barrel.